MNKHLSNKKKKISVLKKSVKSLRYTDESFSRQSYQIYIKLYAKYKASDCSKIRPDLPNLGFCCCCCFKSMKRATFPFYILLTTQKNICCGVHSYCNLSNKFSLQWFLIFLIQQSGCFGSVFFLIYK